MIPVHMELSKFTEMKVTPKVYCERYDYEDLCVILIPCEDDRQSAECSA